MDTPDFSGFISEFVEEAEEHLQTLNTGLLNIEQSAASGVANREKVDSLFRAAHTVKGLSGMMEFEGIERLCHRMEDIFGEIRHGQMPITSEIIDALFAAADTLAKLIIAVRERGTDKGVATDAPLELMNKALLAAQAAPSPASNKGKGKKRKKIDPANLGISLDASQLEEKDLVVLEDAVTAGLWIYELSKEFTGGTPLDKIHRLPVFRDIEQAGMLIAALPPLEHIPGATGTVNCRFIFGSDLPSGTVRDIFLDPIMVLKEGWIAKPPSPSILGEQGPEVPEQWPLNEILAQLDETLIQEFVKSASEQLDQIDLAMLELERDPGDKHIATEIHNGFRSYKGKAALFGFNKIAILAGKLDGIFSLVHNQRVIAGTELFESVAKCTEKLRSLLDELKLHKESGVSVTDDLKRLDALIGKAKWSPEELHAVLARSSLNPEVIAQLSPAEKSLVVEEYEKGRAIYQIVIRFGEDALKSGYEPLSIVPIIEKCGDILVSIPLIDGMPEIFRYEAGRWGIGFHFLFATDLPEEQLNSRFALFPRFMEIDLHKILHKDAPQKRAPGSPMADAPSKPVFVAPTGTLEKKLAAGNSHPNLKEPSAARLDDSPPLERRQSGRAVEDHSAEDAEKKLKEKAVNTIRVDIDRLDKLLNLIGELVIDRTRLEQLSAEVRRQMPTNPLGVQLAHTNQLFQRHINDVQDMVMSVRMVPIGNAFNKFPRIVRDMAKSLGKNVNLVIAGEETELDKTIIEEVGDPLIHLIRNALDHGIESPQERHTAGKPETGQITLKAYHEGDTIIIEVSDDGRGMNLEKIRSIAIKRGLLEPDASSNDKELLQFIFEPGFSTTDVPSMVSGRGVGMDVVKKNIIKLKGLIDIFSEQGKGCVIRLRLPLTLAIVPTLIVGVREETFAIPLSSVAESIRITAEDIRMVNGREMITLRDTVLPLARLDKLFMLDRKPLRKTIPPALPEISTEKSFKGAGRTRRDSIFIVVVGLAEKRLGLMVRDLKRQQQVVIKNLGEMLKDAPGISGATIMGDGRVALILDVGQIIEEAGRRHRQPSPAHNDGRTT